eukprot:1710292-Pyramimonas_sp.AAC.1
MHGTTVTTDRGFSGERHELASAANSGTMIDGTLSILLDIGSNISIIGLETAQTFERVSRAQGHDMRLNLSRPLYVTGVVLEPQCAG